MRKINAKGRLIFGVTVDVLKREIQSSKADLLVLGHRPHSLFSTLVEGSVVQSLLRQA